MPLSEKIKELGLEGTQRYINLNNPYFLVCIGSKSDAAVNIMIIVFCMQSNVLSLLH